jgi:hypothetical protein
MDAYRQAMSRAQALIARGQYRDADRRYALLASAATIYPPVPFPWPARAQAIGRIRAWLRVRIGGRSC